MLIRLTEVDPGTSVRRDVFVNHAHIRHVSLNANNHTALVVGASHPEVFYVDEPPHVINELIAQAKAQVTTLTLDKYREALPALAVAIRRSLGQAPLPFPDDDDEAPFDSIRPQVVRDEDGGPAAPIAPPSIPLAGLAGLAADEPAPGSSLPTDASAEPTIGDPNDRPAGLSKFERNQLASAPVDEPTPAA